MPEKVETFSNDLKKTVKDNKTEIAKSSKSVSTIVDIVKTIANVSTSVTTEIITVRFYLFVNCNYDTTNV